MPEPAARALVAVVVAYGSPDDLGRCLGALDGAMPVVVVDNSSSADVRAVAEGAGADYHDPGRNLGFAAGVNAALGGIELAQTDVLLLNPDAEVDPAAVAALHAELRAAPGVACVAPAQRHPGTGRDVRVCWPFATPARAWLEALGLGRLQRRWDFVIASVLVVRGAALRDVGAFDEGFFLYAEEADWEHRAVGRGWRVRYLPEVTALHEGAGTDTDDERHQLRFHAGVERYVRKWHGAVGWRSYQAATILTALRRALLGRGEGRRRSLALARRYRRGPYAEARRAGVVPDLAYCVPPLA